MTTASHPVTGPLGYEHVSLIGTGASSRVYRGVSVADGRVFALKRLNRHLVRSRDALARLRRELELLQKLSHPGIVNVYDVIHWDGDPTLVMDYVEGEDLEARIVRAGSLSPAEVEDIARALLDILAAAHSAGIVHRDMKPHNIRLGSDGQVTLLDFGSARLDASSQLTATGTTVGTPEYMAPELFAGSVYDPRVDIFGLGATLYEALVGEPPQTADSLAELAWQRAHQPMPSVADGAPQTPDSLVRFVDRCLTSDPSDRFSTASLAVWSLNHPEIERAFGDHRSSHPPCLHCDHPLAPASTCCPHCKSRHPFGFDPGRCDVVVTSMSRPALFIHWLCARFPERVGEADVIADRCAALSISQQRYVSGISREQARAEVDRLAEVGVKAGITPTRSSWGWGVAALVWALVSYQFAGTMFGLGLFFGGFVLAVNRWLGTDERAEDSFLGVAKRGSLLVSWAPHAVVACVTATAIVCTAYRAVAGTPLSRGTILMTTLSGALVALLLHVLFKLMRLNGRLKGSRAPSVLSPRPPKQSVGSPHGDEAVPRSVPRRIGRRGPALGVILAACLLVAAETLTGMSVVSNRHLFNESVDARATTTSSVAADREVALDLVHAGELADGAETSTGQSWFDVLTLAGTALSPGLLAFGLLFLGRRRRRELDRDLTDLTEEVEGTAPRFAVKRIPPMSRRMPGRLRSEEAVALLRAGDGFTQDAVCRASTLANFLGSQARTRLRGALKPLVDAVECSEPAREASLVARCILETDPEQDARFQFLALEGELEAAAATAWWDSRR